MLQEISELEAKGTELSGIGYRRLEQLKMAFKSRQRLLN